MDFDVVVVGSGAGGGAAAWSLSKAGKRVLVVERGRALGGPLLAHDEQRMLQARPASDDRPLLVNGRLTRLFIGGGLGGSTALYGATFVRPSPRDFEPGRFYGEYLPRAQWDWPIDYAALSPYFGEAERLYSVAGDAAAETPHLGRRATAYPAELPPLEPINRRLAAALRAHGLAPFSLPLAIDFSRCQRCPACPGFGCPTGARMSSVNSCLDPARGTGNLTLWLEHEAQTLITARGSVHTLVVLDRTSGERKQVRASLFVLAAGALGTPLLLMRSGLAAGSGQLGRNHMCHLGAGVALTFARDVGAGERNLKQLGVSDLYFGTRRFRHKLGLT